MPELPQIPVERLKPKTGRMRAVFGDSLTYSIEIPLEPFDSGMSYVTQPETTSFRLDDVQLVGKDGAVVSDWRALDGRSFSVPQDESNASIYVGAAHNPVDINSISFKRKIGTTFQVACKLFCDFQHERVAGNVVLLITTEIEFTGLLVKANVMKPTGNNVERLVRWPPVTS